MSDDFDPRFNPAFQRGYDGPAPEPQVSSTRVGVPSGRTAEPVPVAMPRREATEIAESFSSPNIADTRFAESEQLAESERDERRTNPFLIALGAIAALLVGGGLFLVSRLRDLFEDTQSSSNFDFVTLQVLTATAPLLISLGLATGIGVLFVYAVRWQRWR